VTKLFNIVEPDAAFFGRKDFQQYRILERLVRDLDFPIQVFGVPIVRESDGLAMSSRNAMLTPENREKAICIYKALRRARDGAVSGRVRSASTLRDQVAQDIESSCGRVDYVQVVHSMTLQPINEAGVQPTLIAVAAFFGSVRLIDNIDF
jgi:pantoate--beta-alanine ligase